MTSLPKIYRRAPEFGRRSRRRKIILTSLTGLIIAIALGLGTIRFFPGFAATAADTVLRPVIGANATIALESFFFSLSDSLKRLFYASGAKPSSNIYTAPTPPVVHAAAPKPDTLNLSPLNYHPGSYASLPGEGQWSPIVLSELKGRVDLAKTFVRPDPVRSYAIVSLVKMNMHHLLLHAVAGTQQPGGPIGHAGPGVIPWRDQAAQTLVAAFNGGFQYKDGQYGMIVGSTTYVPLKAGLATLVMRQDGTVTIEADNGGPLSNPATITAVRQNGPLIVSQGQVTAATTGGGMALWGLTVTNSMYTWRSGLGVTANGNLIYAVGPSLDTNSLARALQAAGAVNAMQLDINPYWVRYVTFQPSPHGYTDQSLLKDMQNGGYAYLHGYNKDFFYLTVK